MPLVLDEIRARVVYAELLLIHGALRRASAKGRLAEEALRASDGQGIAAGALAGGVVAGSTGRGAGCRASMAVLLDAMAVADTPSLDEEPIAHLEIPPVLAVSQGGTTALYQSQVRQQAGAVVLVAEIGPDDVVEDVRFERLDRARQAGELLGPRPGQAGGVDDEAGDVVEVRVRDEKGVDKMARDVGGIGFGGDVWQREAGKWPCGEGPTGVGLIDRL